ncbi:hypothetical protein [Microcoleus sp. S13_C5]
MTIQKLSARIGLASNSSDRNSYLRSPRLWRGLIFNGCTIINVR